MTSRTRWILVAATAAVVAVAAVTIARPAAVPVDTAIVRRDTLRVTVREEGRTRARDRYVVGAPVTGRLARITLEPGDRVTAGAMVARILPAPVGPRDRVGAQARVDAALARAREADTRHRDAVARAAQQEREAARSRTLADAGAVSPQARERADLEATAAQRAVEAASAMRRAAEADVVAARAALVGDDLDASGPATMVRSPVRGRVLRVLERSERVVTAGTPLLELGETGETGALEIVVDVPSRDAVRITPGDPVLVDEWGGPATLHGRVRVVEPDAFTEVSALGVEEQRVTVVADLDAAPGALGTGYRVEARIVTWMGADVLTVPTSALFEQAGGWHVFVVRDGRAVRQAVRLGQRGEDAAQVLGGVREGERVIAFPSDEIAPGTRVRTTPRDR